MPTPGHEPQQRRAFLGALGAGLAWSLWPRRVAAADAAPVPTAAPTVSATVAAPLGPWPALDDAAGWHALTGLAPELRYLNAGSLGPLFAPTRARQAALAARLELDPAGEAYGALLAEVEAARQTLGTILDSPGDWAFTRNTTDGLWQVALGRAWQAGDTVLTSDQEHPGGLAPWQWLTRTHGVKVQAVPLPPAEPEAWPALLAAAWPASTRVLFISQVTYTTGTRPPLAALATLAHEHGALLVVDGAQALGAGPLGLSAAGVDAWAGSGHKWAHGPRGTGLLWRAIGARETLGQMPLLTARGATTYSAATGTPDLVAQASLLATLMAWHALGWPAVAAAAWQRRQELLGHLAEGAAGALLGPAQAATAVPMCSTRLPAGTAPDELARRLRQQHGIAVRAISHGPLRGLRWSPWLYTRTADCAAVAEALHAALR